MKISDFLSQADVMVDVRASDKRQLLHELARKAASALDLPADAIASALFKREELGSTGTGGGIAIPHARMQALVKPFGILVKLRQPIDFDAIDGQPVDLIFVLLLPATAEGGQLGALASVARKLRASDSLVQLRGAENASELYSSMIG
jgi:PTS system nitrogen regulatory IIA component